MREKDWGAGAEGEGVQADLERVYIGPEPGRVAVMYVFILVSNLSPQFYLSSCGGTFDL